MNLDNLMQNLVKFFHTDNFKMDFYRSGASSRRYYLVQFQNHFYFPHSKILMATYSHSENGSFDDYIKINNYFKRKNIPTPRIFEINRHERWIFLEYIQYPTVEEFLNANSENMPEILITLVDLIFAIQKTCIYEFHCPAFHRQFDKNKFLFEFNFHVREQLLQNYYRHHLTGEAERHFLQFATEISQTLDIPEKVFVHRDFQSSNLLCANQGTPSQFKIIDFQDARLGNPIYDVVSLLWDSYIDIPEKLREEILERYYLNLKKLGYGWELKDYRKMVDYAVIQRKLHDAGAFAYNFHRFKSEKYISYIPGSIQMAIEKMENYPNFLPMVEMFNKLRR